MNRVEIKNKAKEMIKGNKWYLWKPFVIYSLVVFCIAFVVGFALQAAGDAGKVISLIVECVLSFFEVAFLIAYAKYVIEFVRGNKMEWKEVFVFAKDHIWSFFVISFVVGLNIVIGSILLIIPGIIAAFGLFFYQEVAADNPDMGCMEVMKKSWEITNGHKMELFILMLSFIGWQIVASLTLGILYIWLFPYMTVTVILAYEELKK